MIAGLQAGKCACGSIVYGSTIAARVNLLGAEAPTPLRDRRGIKTNIRDQGMLKGCA